MPPNRFVVSSVLHDILAHMYRRTLLKSGRIRSNNREGRKLVPGRRNNGNYYKQLLGQDDDDVVDILIMMMIS